MKNCIVQFAQLYKFQSPIDSKFEIVKIIGETLISEMSSYSGLNAYYSNYENLKIDFKERILYELNNFPNHQFLKMPFLTDDQGNDLPVNKYKVAVYSADVIKKSVNFGLILISYDYVVLNLIERQLIFSKDDNAEKLLQENLGISHLSSITLPKDAFIYSYQQINVPVLK